MLVAEFHSFLPNFRPSFYHQLFAWTLEAVFMVARASERLGWETFAMAMLVREVIAPLPKSSKSGAENVRADLPLTALLFLL